MNSCINTDKAEYLNNPRLDMKKYIPENAMRILDIGCCDGAFCSLLKQPGREMWGVEMNEQTAQKAMLVFDKVLVGDFNAVFDQLPDNYFDCVVFNDVLEHIYSPWNTLEMIKKILKKGGVVVSSIPNFRYITNMIEVVLHGEFRYRPEGGILDDTHIRFFTSQSIRDMYEGLHYQILTHDGINSRNDWKMKLVRLLSLGKMSDMSHSQFATVARVNKNK